VVTQHRTDESGDDEMFPVRALAALVIRIQSYASVTSQGTTRVGINALESADGSGLRGILSKEVLKQLRDAAAAVGEKKLGFPVDRIGTHSIRAGAAMAMFLAGVPCETIQLIGRWRSRTFMKYLRIQVTALTRGVTTKMTSLRSFFTVTMSDNLDENYEETRLQKWPKPGQHARPRTNKPGTRRAKQQGKAKDHELGPDSEATKLPY
jgi:hypothetical protein